MAQDPTHTLPFNEGKLAKELANLLSPYGFTDVPHGFKKFSERFVYRVDIKAQVADITADTPVAIGVRIIDLFVPEQHDPLMVSAAIPSYSAFFSVSDEHIEATLKDIKAYFNDVYLPLLEKLEAGSSDVSQFEAYKDEWETYGFYGKEHQPVRGFQTNLFTMLNLFGTKSPEATLNSYFDTLSKANKVTFKRVYAGDIAFPTAIDHEGYQPDVAGITYDYIRQGRALLVKLKDVQYEDYIPEGVADDATIIDMDNEGFDIGSHRFEWPVKVEDILSKIPDARTVSYVDESQGPVTRYVWDELGINITVSPENSEYMLSLTTFIETGESNEDPDPYANRPKQPFSGILRIYGSDYRRVLFIDVMSNSNYAELFTKTTYFAGSLNGDVTNRYITRVLAVNETVPKIQDEANGE